MTSKSFVGFFIAAGLTCPGTTALAQSCATTLVYQPDASRPIVSGKLVYHNYASYGDGTSRLYLYDFRIAKLTELSSGWGITDPMNAHFSPDGQWITFMGIQNNQWHVFLWKVGATTTLPTNLTSTLGVHRNEDPKFSSDGKRIAFKQDGDIRIATLNFLTSPPTIAAIQMVTNDRMAVEESMPFLSPSGKYVYFTRGARASSDIYRTNLTTNATKQVVGTVGVADYYPIIRDSSSFFYVRWDTAVSKRDQIYMNIPNLVINTPLGLNHCLSNNSDPAPVDEDLLVFSGTREGRYKLYLGDVGTGNVWRLDVLGINSLPYNNVLGASYSR